MIRLSLLAGPVTVESPHYPGVTVTLRRLTSLELGAAWAATRKVLNDARQALEALAPYGLIGPDANGAHLDPRNPDQMSRAGRLVGAVEIALAAVTGWSGIALEDGAPAPVTRETLSVLLLDDGVERWLTGEIEAAARILVTEGNGSGPSPHGRSAATPKAGDPNIAAAAPPATSPAPAESAGPAAMAAPAASVLRSSTLRKRSRAGASGV